MKIYRQNLNSSVISFAAWDSEFDILYIQFPSGSCWIYHEVNFEMYHDLIHAKSSGNFFNKNIRNNKHIYGEQAFIGRKELARA